LATAGAVGVFAELDAPNPPPPGLFYIVWNFILPAPPMLLLRLFALLDLFRPEDAPRPPFAAACFATFLKRYSSRPLTLIGMSLPRSLQMSSPRVL